jgi:hypothetical protein
MTPNQSVVGSVNTSMHHKWSLFATALLCSLGGLTAFSIGNASAGRPPARTLAADPCALPSLPKPGHSTGSTGAPRMIGPAVAALTGGAARQSFSVDGTDLTVAPPHASDHPRIASARAECDALAALNIQNAPLSSEIGSGVAIGYGRVTVSSTLFPPVTGIPGSTDITPGDVQAKFPSATPYENRLAWVVIFTHRVVLPCPMQQSVPTTTTAPLATDYDYEVFLLNAHSGRDAQLFTESQPNPCGGTGRLPTSLSQPSEQVSAPWSLMSRRSNSYSGTIVASVLPCDGYSSPQFIDREGDGLQVIVTRPIGASCGSLELVPLRLDAATVTSKLPATIKHDPVGLYTGLTGDISNRNAAVP